MCSYISINDSTKVTKIWPALPALPSLTNRSLLSKREGNLKSGQCISILDWLSEHAEVSFRLIIKSHQMSFSSCIVRWGRG